MRHTLLSLAALALPATAVVANDLDEDGDFPTQARVEYVLGCMKIRGGEDYNSLYGCVCKIDHLRSKFSYDEYSEAEVYRQLRSTPGERGGVFRDPDQAENLRERLLAEDDAAERRCFGEQAARRK